MSHTGFALALQNPLISFINDKDDHFRHLTN